MGFTDYARKTETGVEFTLDNLPKTAFIDVVKVRDIAKATIVNRKDYDIKAASGDVKLQRVGCGVQFITRSQLSKIYLTAKGRKIIVPYLKNGVSYIVQAHCKESCKAMKLPDNCTVILRNNPVPSGSYVVCKADKDGNPDMNSISIISPKIFRKMFKIPLQPIIQKYIGKAGSRQFSLYSRQRNRTKQTTSSQIPEVFNNTSGFGTGAVKDPTISIQKQPIVNNQQASVKQTTTTATPKIDTAKLGIDPKNIQVPTKYKFRIDKKIMSMSNPKMQIGYMVTDIDSGVQNKYTMSAVYRMCEEKLVENAMIVTRPNGMKFMRGNGVILENLPQVYL